MKYTVDDAVRAAVERAARDPEGSFAVCTAPDGGVWMLDARAVRPEGSRTYAVVQRWDDTTVQIRRQHGESEWVKL